MYTILAHTLQITYSFSVIKKKFVNTKCPMLKVKIITHYYMQEDFMLKLVQIVVTHKAVIF